MAYITSRANFLANCPTCDRLHTRVASLPTFAVVVMPDTVALICTACGEGQTIAVHTPRGSRWGEALAQAGRPA